MHFEDNGVLKDIDNSLEEKEDTLDELLILEEDLLDNENGILQSNNNIEEMTNDINSNTEGNESNTEDNSNKNKENSNEKNKIFENKENKFKVKFSKKSKKHNLVSMTSKGTTIKWGIKGSKNINGKKEEKKKARSVDNKKEDTVLEKLNSAVTYEEILDGIDLRYDIGGDGVKESIILKSKESANTPIVFTYDVGDKIMELLEDGKIVISDANSENPDFIMDSLYMFDMNTITSKEVIVEIEKKNGKYLLKITPNKEWLEAKERAYPVVIDPTIRTSLYYNDIEDTFVYDGDWRNSERYRAHILRVGSNNTVKTPTRSLVKFKLPELTSGDQVTNAIFTFCNYPDTNEWAPPSSPFQINVYKMVQDWDQVSANWENTKSGHDSRIEDFIQYEYDANDPFRRNICDVTSAVKDWYTTGNNFGLMLTDNGETNDYPRSDAYFVSANTSSAYTQGRPMVEITYRNQTGIEDYLSYHTQSVGRAGNIYTNDYNGNVILSHDDLGTPGARMPVSIGHVYNTNDKNKDIGYGRGYRLNLSQKITKVRIEDIDYARYEDEDGTVHYLRKQGELNKYIDEDGINLTLSDNGNELILWDNSAHTFRFNKLSIGGIDTWCLYAANDPNGNRATITVNGEGKVTKIVDCAGVAIDMTYQNGHLATMKDSTGKTITYNYDTGNNYTLKEIVYWDNKKSIYTYNEDSLLTSVKNIDGAHIDYEYYLEKTSRVKQIKEYSIANELGNSLSISYGNNTTTFEDNKGYKNIYSFDNWGHNTGISDFGKDSGIDNAYGKSYKYGTGGSTLNKLTLDSKLIAIDQMPNNLLINPKFENEQNNWYKNSGCKENDHIEVGKFRFYGEDNTVKSIVQYIGTAGKKGDIYNFCGWINTQAVQTRDNRSVGIRIGLVRADNTVQWTQMKANTDTRGWQFLSNEAIADKDYVRIEYYIDCNNNANNTWYDNLGLFKEELGNSYEYDGNGNIVSSKDQAKNNSTFANGATSELLKSVTPRGGKYAYEYDAVFKERLKRAINTVGMQYIFNHDVYGNTTNAKVEGSPKSDPVENNGVYNIHTMENTKILDVPASATSNGTKLQQWEPNIVRDNQKFKITNIEDGYCRITPMHATNLSLAADNGNLIIWNWDGGNKQKWKIVEQEDGSYKIYNKEVGQEKLLTLKDDHIENEGSFVLEKDEGKVNQRIIFKNINGEGNIYDETFLESNEVYRIRVKSSNLYLDMDSDTLASGISQNVLLPGNKSQLWRISRNANNQYWITNIGSKDEHNINVREAQNVLNQPIDLYNYTENQINQLWTIEKNSDNTFSIFSAMSGIKSAITTKNNSKMPESMVIYESNGGDNQKFYLEKHDMTNIDAGATYKIKVKSSGQYLTNTNNYIDQRKLSNNQNQEWMIKNMNNGYYAIVSKNNPNLAMDLTNGNTSPGTSIGMHQYSVGNVAEQFAFTPDAENSYYIRPRLGYGRRSFDINNNSMYEYDNMNRTTKVSEQVRTKTYENTYTYENDKIKTINHNGFSYTFDYDNFGNTKQVKVGNVALVTNNYEGNNGNLNNVKYGNNQTITYEYDRFDRITKKTGTIAQLKNGNSEELKYTYDKIGNIQTISRGSNLLQKYYYDELSQLVREDNSELNKTIVYTYDVGGNIQNKKEYEYTSEEITKAPTKTIAYEYGNTNWKDQLTKYDGKAITYDEIGNPISYNQNTYTWRNGRELQSLVNAEKGNNISYKYNESGIRTEKVVNGVSTKYYLEGNKVIYEVTGTNKIYYNYDENGEVIGLKYNNAQYYYIKNVQNDIIGILDSNLNQVVSYSYDSWGKITKIKDGNGNDVSGSVDNIGNVNPYRYRGYRYDEESGLYYLQSRYYDGELGRFINSDGIFESGHELLGNNMYIYCANNPVNNVDPDGDFIIAISFATIATVIVKAIIVTGSVAVIATVAIAIGAAVSYISDYVKPNKSSSNTNSRSKDKIGKRENFPTRKEAKDAAQKAGKGKKPIFHKNGTGGKHFHPNVPEIKGQPTPHQPSPHDHYYFPFISKKLKLTEDN